MSTIPGKKIQHRVVRNINKELPNRELLNETFHPKDPSNLKTDYLLDNFSILIADALIKELTHKRKVRCNYLSAVARL